MYNLPKLNYIPHRDHPTPHYQKTIQILKQYKISLQELTKGKIRQIYNRLSYPDKRPSDQETFRWKLATSSILPNYLNTFNYRTVRHLLPFSPEPSECALCLKLQDTAVHVFAKCSITRQLLDELTRGSERNHPNNFPTGRPHTPELLHPNPVWKFHRNHCLTFHSNELLHLADTAKTVEY